MRHDPALAAVPSAPVPQLSTADPRRVIEIEVWLHYIDTALRTAPDALPFDAARHLVRRLEQSGAALVRRGNVTCQMQLLGISASTDGSDYALLRNWENAALARLREARA